MTDNPALRVADLSQNSPTSFDIRPDITTLKALAEEFGLRGLRKLRFSGQIMAKDRRDWQLTATLGVTALQVCVVTLDPISTRIDVPVKRQFLAGVETSDEPEIEIPEDDNVELLGSHIDPHAIMLEALTLVLPQYPRKDGATLGESIYTEPGQAPMRDEDTRPFAGLADLRKQHKKDS
ncbi:MAG: hypothetical protein COB16_14120 [Rhodobacteraceae bacterium]|nr:MAG: hypothetical protein COB16_14120 [Paracoccaceae bacterium]